MNPAEVAKIIRTLRQLEQRHILLRYEGGMLRCLCGALVTDLESHQDELLTQLHLRKEV